MKVIKLSVLILILGIGYAMNVMGSCPTSHPIVHDGSGGVVVPCQYIACPHTPKFWCLSGGTGNNNGTYTSWWFWYPGGKFNGDWAAAGVQGCCGMWDATSFDSKTMTAVIEVAYNEGSIAHSGYTDVEVAEGRSNGFFFTRYYDLFAQAIPRLKISSFNSTGPGGVSTFQVNGFAAGSAAIDYWVILQNGTNALNLPLNPLCSPGGASPCPPPIEGYRVVAKTAGCADGTCTDPTPAPPTTSVASQWNLPVANRDIQGRVPTFPKTGFQITNPDHVDPTNAYIYIATVMLYGYDNSWDGRIAGVYTSGNSIGFAWASWLLGEEITSLQANYVSAGRIKISWKSVVEGNVAGYNVYRSYNANGTYSRINNRTIPAKGADGSTYYYTDRIISGLPRDVYYRIEVVHHDGTSVLAKDVVKVDAKPRNALPMK